MKPTFSLLIATKNAAPTINNAITSVLQQSFENWELVIQDGMSNDNTVGLCRNFKDTRIKICTQADDGIYDALNKALERAKGEMILVLGSDDRLTDSSVLNDISEELEAMQRTTTFPDLVYGDVILVGDSRLGSHGERYGGEFSIRRILRQNICQQAIFYSKQALQSLGGFPLDYPYCADWVTNWHFFATKSCHYVDRTVAFYTTSGASSHIDKAFELDRRALAIKIFGDIATATPPAAWTFFKIIAKDFLTGKFEEALDNIRWFRQWKKRRSERCL